MLIIGNLLWGVSFPVIKALASLNRGFFPQAGSWFISSQALEPRFLLGAMFLALFLPGAVARMSRSEASQGVALGLFATGGSLFQTDGLQYTAASTSAFLTQFSAILIPVWLAMRHRRSPGWGVWVGCVLVLAGVAVLGRFDVRTFSLGRGEWETLLSSAFFTAQILWLEKPVYSGNRAGQVTFAMFSTEALCFLALSLCSAPAPEDLLLPWASAPWIALTLVLALACTVGAFSLMNFWQPKVTATEAGLIYCIEPLFASIFALFVPGLLTGAGTGYPNESLSPSLLIGGGLITGANVLVLMGRGSKGQNSSD